MAPATIQTWLATRINFVLNALLLPVPQTASFFTSHTNMSGLVHPYIGLRVKRRVWSAITKSTGNSILRHPIPSLLFIYLQREFYDMLEG